MTFLGVHLRQATADFRLREISISPHFCILVAKISKKIVDTKRIRFSGAFWAVVNAPLILCQRGIERYVLNFENLL